MTVRMSPEEYEELKRKQNRKSGSAQEGTQLTPAALKPLADQYDRALAIDPGKETMHVAWSNGSRVVVWGTTFWELCREPFGNRPTVKSIPLDPNETALILEAPYLSAPEKSDRTPSAVAYGSGMVAREAQLLKARLAHLGYEVEEFDPARYQSGSWSADTADHFVGDFDGPNNEHARDAVRLLFFYDFI